MGVAKAPKRVTVLTRGHDGTLSAKPQAGVVDEPKRKKGTKGFGLIEKIVRTGVRAGVATGDSYLARHKKSNEKKKDGWVKDAPVNLVRSGLKGMKKVKISKFI